MAKYLLVAAVAALLLVSASAGRPNNPGKPTDKPGNGKKPTCAVGANGCAKCRKNKCVECMAPAAGATGMFVDGKGVCRPCKDANCAVCNKSGQCKTCVAGTALKGSKCKPCGEGFVAVKGRCKACPKNCVSCTANSKCKPDGCAEGFVFKADSKKCVKPAPAPTPAPAPAA